MIPYPEMSIDYTLTYRDYKAGHKLGARQSVPIFLFHILARYIALAIACVLLLMCVVNTAAGHWALVVPILPLVFLFFLMPSVFWLSWRYSFKKLQISRARDPVMKFQADETSFSRQIHQMGDLTWLWSATHSIAQNKQVVLVAARKGNFVIIPRTAITDLQISRLREMLRDSKANPC